MNTKNSEIGSGLVAHIAAFKEALNGTRGDLDAWLECNDEAEVRQAIFGVLSDAEAIINDLNNLVIAENQRKQQLEEDRDTWKARAEFSYAQRDKQSAALKLASLALSEGVEYVDEPPERNCTCHLAPPCNDCVDHSAVREFFIDARKALAAIDALKGE